MTNTTLQRNLILFILLLFTTTILIADPTEPFTAQDLLNMKYVTSAKLSPDGRYIAYTKRVPRKAGDEPGHAYVELYRYSFKSKKSQPFVTGKVSVSGIAWHPAGKGISFLSKRGDDKHKQVWFIPTDGGEALRVTNSESSVKSYQWFPNGKKLAYIAQTGKSKREKALKEKGYGFSFVEENIKSNNLFIQNFNALSSKVEAQQITRDYHIWDFRIDPAGKNIALTKTGQNLIDQKYMFRHIYLLNLESAKLTRLSDNDGKLGNYEFSPNGKHLTYCAASKKMDHAVSSVFVVPVSGGENKNLTIENFRGHVNWVSWKNNKEIIYRSGEGVQQTLSAVNRNGGERKILYHSKNTGIIFDKLSFTADLKNTVFIGETPKTPDDLYQWKPGQKPIKLTESNNWKKTRRFGKQVAIRYSARDGVEVEGLLIYPIDYQNGRKYPLVVFVHGGPESHYSNGWMSAYSRPGQVLAGKGYFVFYPNYRGSTGYGFDYAMKWHYNNPAGTEFDDVADGIDYLVKEGLVDKERVGLGGGSYGGYAAAWFGTYYTEKVRAVSMFVGISNLISKRGTTDIPWEELYVHSGKKLEEMWDLSLKRSPIYYAHQSKSAVLILGGENDTRVHPSQSLELFRRLKVNNHPATRLVQYPGEGHGNGKQPGRIDLLYRTLDWWDWYVKDKKPLDGEMPPLDISDKYGLDLD